MPNNIFIYNNKVDVDLLTQFYASNPEEPYITPEDEVNLDAKSSMSDLQEVKVSGIDDHPFC